MIDLAKLPMKTLKVLHSSGPLETGEVINSEDPIAYLEKYLIQDDTDAARIRIEQDGTRVTVTTTDRAWTMELEVQP